MTMADEKTARYVAYIDSLITVSPKSQSAISREIGYKNPNILSLIKGKNSAAGRESATTGRSTECGPSTSHDDGS